jgi:hypothetical protein
MKSNKFNFLFKTSLTIGLVALLGGWSIFFIWTGGRYIGAWDFEFLEIIGFFWIAGFFWLSLFALLLLIIYIVLNRKNLHLKMLYLAILILINVPSVFVIIPWQGAIDNKVFVKLTNESQLGDLELKLQGDQESWDLGILKSEGSKVINYDPPYPNIGGRLYQNPDTLILIIQNGQFIDSVGFPTLRMGACRQLV